MGGVTHHGGLLPVPANYIEEGFLVCDYCGRLKPKEQFTKDPLICDECQKVELIKPDFNNSLYNIVKGIELIKLCHLINSTKPILENIELFKQCEINSDNCRLLGKVLEAEKLREIAFYFTENGAATQLILSSQLSVSRQIVSHDIQFLLRHKFIDLCTKLPRFMKKGGQKVRVYQTLMASEDQIESACSLHRKLESPTYSLAQRTTQTLLNEYFTPRHRNEISYSDLMEWLKERKVPERLATVEFIIQSLAAAGVKVWR